MAKPPRCRTHTPRRMRFPCTQRGVRAAVCLLALVLACCGLCDAQATQPDISLEYAVKATYLYKLAPFVDWPPNAFGSADAPFAICIVGEDPFKGFLERAVAGRSVGAHPFVVRKLDALTASTDCRIAFIGHLRAQTLNDALATVQGQPVLTVTDSNIGAHTGSIIQFVIDRGRVRFDIDVEAAARNHLSISSKLLNLATTVKDNG